MERAQTLVLNTANRMAGDPWDALYNVPYGFVKCENGEQMSLMLQSVSIYRSWYQIDLTNNSFEYKADSQANWTRIEVPPGNYRFVQLAQLVTKLITGIDDYMEYLPAENKVQFWFNELTQLRWTSRLWEVIGFLPVDRYGLVFKSDNPITPVQDMLYVMCDGVTPEAFNVTNIGVAKGDMTMTTILGSFPLTGSPWTYTVYRAAENEYRTKLENKDLSQFRIRFVTGDGRPATFLQDLTMTLRVFFNRVDRSEDLLERLNETTRMHMLNWHLNRVPAAGNGVVPNYRPNQI